MGEFDLDVVTSTTGPEREQRAMEVLRQWLSAESSTQIDRPELLIRKESGIQIEQLRSLIDQRDNTRVLLSE